MMSDTNASMNGAARTTTGKVRPHQTQNESLVFEKSSPGKRGYKLPPLDVPAIDTKALLGSAAREVPAAVAGVERD